MTTLTVLKRLKPQRIGKTPIVVLPLADYERMKEDLEMFYARKLAKDIREARKEIKEGRVLTLAEVKKRLKLR